MKKIFTLALSSFMTLALFAADRRPSVTLTADKSYEVVIDGISYASAIGNAMNVSLSNSKRHTVKVYELKNGLFSKQRKLVSSNTFQLDRGNLSINVNRTGSISIVQERNSYNNRYDQDKYNRPSRKNEDRRVRN